MREVNRPMDIQIHCVCERDRIKGRGKWTLFPKHAISIFMHNATIMEFPLKSHLSQPKIIDATIMCVRVPLCLSHCLFAHRDCFREKKIILLSQDQANKQCPANNIPSYSRRWKKNATCFTPCDIDRCIHLSLESTF